MSFTLSLTADVVEVEAGATTPVGLSIVNRGTASDRFEVEIEGIDPEWRFVPVPVFVVEPGEEHTEKLFLKPPRQPESVAGSYPFVVRVRSLESGEARTAQALLKLKAYHHLTMEIGPKKGVVSPTTKRNDFRVTIVNLGNSEHTLQLSAQDPDDRCAYEFESDGMVLGPGQQREVEVVVEPRQKPFLSSARLIGFSVTARSMNERNASATAQAQLEQRSLFSPATLIGGIALIALLGGWWAMRPQPASIDLSVNPLQAIQGQPVRLSWVAKNADRVRIVADEKTIYEGPANPTDPVTYTPNGTGMITLIATPSRDGKPGATDTERLSVDAPVVAPEPVINKFWTDAKRVKLGTSFVVNWDVSNAAKVAVTPVEDNLAPELGQKEITPTTTGRQTYKLIAFNADGKTTERSLTVEVYEESDAVILAFSADPSVAKEDEGGRTGLSWQVTNAELVTLQVGADKPEKVDLSGTREFNLSAKTTFILTALDQKGRKTVRQVTVDLEKTPISIEPTTAGGTTTTTTGGEPPVTTTGGTVEPPR